MAITQTHIGEGGLCDRLDRFLAGVGQGFNAYLESQSRIDEIRRLESKSDDELNAMGLTREGIPQHVFRDMLGI